MPLLFYLNVYCNTERLFFGTNKTLFILNKFLIYIVFVFCPLFTPYHYHCHYHYRHRQCYRYHYHYYYYYYYYVKERNF